MALSLSSKFQWPVKIWWRMAGSEKTSFIGVCVRVLMFLLHVPYRGACTIPRASDMSTHSRDRVCMYSALYRTYHCSCPSIDTYRARMQVLRQPPCIASYQIPQSLVYSCREYIPQTPHDPCVTAALTATGGFVSI